MSKKLAEGVIMAVVVVAVISVTLNVVLLRKSSPVSNTQQSPAMSNTQQVIDTVLGYLDHILKERQEQDMDKRADLLWQSVVDYLYDYPTQIELTDFNTQTCLSICLTYTSASTDFNYELPQFHDDYASMRVHLNYPDVLEGHRRSTFVFTLKMRPADYRVSRVMNLPEGGAGWRIVQYYLSYTEVPLWRQYVR